MNRKILATAICAGLFMTGGAWAQDNGAQPQDQSASTQNKDQKKTLQAVVVTGSLIPQAEIETASPVLTITSKDIETQGFKNVYDELMQRFLVAEFRTHTGFLRELGAIHDEFAGRTPGGRGASMIGGQPVG